MFSRYNFSLLLICIFLYKGFQAFSQTGDKPLRVEIEAGISDNYNIIPVGEKGVLLFYKHQKEKNRGVYKWVFDFYDTEFRLKWSKEKFLPQELDFRKYYSDDYNLYLYYENMTGKAVPLVFKILKLNINDTVIDEYSGVIDGRYNITEFLVSDGKAIIAGRKLPGRAASISQAAFSFTLIPAFTGANFLKFKSAVFLYDFNAKTITEASPAYLGQSWVESLYSGDNDSTAYVISRNHVPRKYNSLVVSKLNTLNNTVKDFTIQSPEQSKKLSTARMAITPDGRKLIVGTYNNFSKGKKANPAFYGFNEKSNGLFLSKILDDSVEFVRFYSFSEFPEFLGNSYSVYNFRVKKKIIRQREKGKDAAFNYNLLFHSVIERDDKFYVIAEAYYPEYHTRYFTTYDYYGRPVTSTYTVFDGYRYTGALIACFNSEGALLWSQSLRIWDVLTYNLSEKVKVLFDNEDIVMAYSREGSISSLVIRGNEIISGKASYPIESSFSRDKLINDYNSGLEYWYGNYFISYGYQKIKNTQETSTNKRNVFYFNKIAFR